MHNNTLRHFHTFLNEEKKKQRRLAAFLVTHVLVLDESIAQKIRDHFLRCTQSKSTRSGRVLLLKQKRPFRSRNVMPFEPRRFKQKCLLSLAAHSNSAIHLGRQGK
jgi:hypothetical protein